MAGGEVIALHEEEGKDSATYHPLNDPRRFSSLWLDADTVVKGSLIFEDIRTTTEQDFRGIGVRIRLRQKCGCARQGIIAASNITDHRSGEVG